MKIKARPDITADLPVLVNPRICDLCGACIGVCPPDCIEMTEHSLTVIGHACIKCGFCIPVCPLAALTWNEDGKVDLEEGE